MSQPNFLMNNKQVYLGFEILDFSRIAMHEFWYDYLETYYGSKAQLCSDSFLIYIKSKEFYKNIKDDVKKDLIHQIMKSKRPLTIGKSKKVIGSWKDKLGGEMMETLVVLRPKMHSHKKGSG